MAATSDYNCVAKLDKYEDQLDSFDNDIKAGDISVSVQLDRNLLKALVDILQQRSDRPDNCQEMFKMADKICSKYQI